MTKTLAKALLLLSVMVWVSLAQTTLTTTTLSAAVNSTTQTVTVASATNISARGLAQAKGGVGGSTTPPNLTILFVDREAMEVQAVSSTTITVRRHAQGTGEASHVSGAKVWVAAAGALKSFDPSGACTASLLEFLPWINTTTGRKWNCGNGAWTTFDGFYPTEGASIASSTSATIAPTNPIHIVSGTSAITTITLPPACPAVCSVTLIPTGAFTTTNAVNIAIASTAVVGKALVMIYLPSTGKWYPSY